MIVASPESADTSAVPRQSVPGAYGWPSGWDTQRFAASAVIPFWYAGWAMK